MLINGWNRYHAGQIPITSLPTNTDTTVTIGYDSQTLPVGYTDKFYVGGVSLTSASLATELSADRAFLAASNTNSGATSIQLTGLQANKWYSVVVRRFNDAGSPTGTYSNHEIVNTYKTDLVETEANATLTFNPATDSFYDWFMPYGDAHKLRVTRMNDGTMGDFVRLQGHNDYGTTGALYLQWEGLKFVSSRWDWSLKYKVRHNGGGAEQHRVGFVSGDQAEVNIEFWRAHGIQPNSSEDMFFDDNANWPAGYDSGSTISGDNGNDNTCKVWGTVRSDTTYPGSVVGTVEDYRDWQMYPDTSHPDIDDWEILTNAVGNIEFRYTASTDKLEVLINDVIVQTFANVQQVLAERLKWPVGEEYPFPIAPNIRLQYMNGTSVYVDIGEIVFTSDCPYDMACFLSSSGAEQSIHGVQDFLNPTFIKPEANTITDCAWIECHTQNRFSVDRHSGYSLPSSNFGGGYFTYDEGCEWDNGDSGNFKILPVSMNGRLLRKLRWTGRPYLGTVQGRLLDASDDSQIQGWHNMTGILSQSLLDGPTTVPDTVLPQISLSYTGSTGTITTAPYYSPSKFMGVELYLASTKAVRVGDTVELTAWTGATIYYGWDSDPVTNVYSSAITIPQGVQVLHFYGEEGSYTENEKTFYISPIKTITGGLSGTLQKINGALSGPIKKYVGGSWQ